MKYGIIRLAYAAFPWLLLVGLLIFGLVSCNFVKGPRHKHKDGYSVVKLEGCEYIEVTYNLGWQTGYYSLTHKGNCLNPIHQCQK